MGQYRHENGIQISFDDKKEKVIEKQIELLINELKAGYFLAGFHISLPIQILSTYCNVSNVTDSDLRASLIFAAGVRLQRFEECKLEMFLKALGEEVNKYIRRPLQPFHLLFPLNLQSDKVPTIPIKIKNICFKVMNWDSVRGNYDIDSLLEGIKEFIKFNHDAEYWNLDSVPLLTEIYGRNAEEAFRRGEEVYDMYRSFINYLQDHSIKAQFSRPSPLASITPAVGYGVFLPSGQLEGPYVNLDHLNHQSLCNNEIDAANLQDIIDKANSGSKLNLRFVNAIKSHNLGLETTNWDTAYLSYWRTFEVICFGNRLDYNMSDVVKRVCIIIGNGAKDFLDICAEQRNGLVHRGRSPSDPQPIVLLLKYFSSLCIRRFQRVIDQYPTEKMLEEFFTQAKFDSEELVERNKVINNILAKRKI